MRILNRLVSQNRKSNPRRRSRRRGTTIILAVVALFIVGVFSAELVRTIARCSDAESERFLRQQAAWLAEAGGHRAASRLQGKDAYPGEVWEIPASELGGNAGRVEIRVVSDPAVPGKRQVTVTADFPRDLPHRNRVVKTLSISVAAQTP